MGRPRDTTIRTLDKPPGLPVFPPHADPGADCLLARLLIEEPWRAAEAWPEGFAGGIAHRLDTATSGALLVAGSAAELAAIRAWFAGGLLVKTYVLVAARDAPWHENRCDRRLAHAPRRKDRMVVERGPRTPHRGRWYPAHTTFRALGARRYQAVITTGVTHQIRAHAAFLGIPLAGDRHYGGGPPPVEAPPGVAFLLHHVGVTGPEGFGSLPVALPGWARAR